MLNVKYDLLQAISDGIGQAMSESIQRNYGRDSLTPSESADMLATVALALSYELGVFQSLMEHLEEAADGMDEPLDLDPRVLREAYESVRMAGKSLGSDEFGTLETIMMATSAALSVDAGSGVVAQMVQAALMSLEGLKN